MSKRFLSVVRKRLKTGSSFPYLESNVLKVRNLEYLKRAMGWTTNPVLEGEHLHTFQYLEDLNDRRIRDAEVIGAACCNGKPNILLEIGTSYGRTTALMARNAPEGMVYTVNILPEDIEKGGEHISVALSREEIGKEYREKGCTNVRQIFANTLQWEPDFGPIDVVFIDGCHDAEFVFNDTKKALKKCRPGSLILWHDFAPELAKVYDWIWEVCKGVNRLFATGLIRDRVLHMQDSWVGIYRVPTD